MKIFLQTYLQIFVLIIRITLIILLFNWSKSTLPSIVRPYMFCVIFSKKKKITSIKLLIRILKDLLNCFNLENLTEKGKKSTFAWSTRMYYRILGSEGVTKFLIVNFKYQVVEQCSSFEFLLIICFSISRLRIHKSWYDN